MNSENLSQIIQKYLDGTPAGYSTKDGKIIAWKSKKAKPTKSQIEEIRQILELEEAEKKAKNDKQRQIIKELGAEDIIEALTKQVNELREAVISGDNTELEKTKTLIDKV